jgi:glycosyltransferase involved in cell wall biosynthesis
MISPRIPIIVAAPPMRTGGTEQHLLYVLPPLLARGFDITVVLLEGGGALEQRLRESGVDVVAPRFKLMRPLRTMNQAMLICSAVKRTGAKVVHAFLSEPYLAASLSQLMTTRPRPALIHGRRSLAFYAARHKFARPIEVVAHRLTTVLVGNSTAVANELIAESRNPDKVCVIHNGIPIGDLVISLERQRARKTFGLSDDAFVMTLVANFHSYKGHADLLAALALVADSLPQPWRLVLPGRDGGKESGTLEQVKCEISRLGFRDNVVLPGEWEGSREAYAAADVGLLVSHTEGFSNSLIEGMAAGLPMIATRVGGNTDALDDAKTGYLVEPKAPEELANAILALAEMPELRKRLGLAARQKVLDHFSLNACVDQYERLWRGANDKCSGNPADWLNDKPQI